MEITQGGEEGSGPYELTGRDFAMFSNYIQYFVSMFGLVDYDINLAFGGVNSISTSRASFWINEDAKAIRIDCTPKWDIKPTPYNLARVAYHEIVECIVSRIEAMGKRRFATEEEFEGVCHSVVRIFENTHFQLMWAAGVLKNVEKGNRLKGLPGMACQKTVSIVR
jgi:hypothetical protein